MSVNQTAQSGSDFAKRVLDEAKYVCDYVRENRFSYGDAPVNPAVNCDARLVSCDRMVGWVLYRLGYTDMPEKKGLCVSGPMLTDWCVDHGFGRVDSVADMRPGDIVFSKPLPPADFPGHTFIFAGTSDTDGLYYRYDCGRQARIDSVQPSLEPIEQFMYAYRPVPPAGPFVAGFSFTYDGTPFSDLDCRVEKTPDRITYTLPDGLEVTVKIRRFPETGVTWQTLYWNNPTDHPSGLIGNEWDCDVTLPFTPDSPKSRRNRESTWEINTFKIIRTNGANVTDDDNMPYEKRLRAGQSYADRCVAGRSGMGTAPFFDINQGEHGYLMAIGWTGEWNVRFDRTEDACRIRSGLESLHADGHGFRVLPGESFRTSSVAFMPYFRGQDEAHNRFRRFVGSISPLGKGSPRGENVPFSAIFWGGISTDEMISRWSDLFDNKFPFDTCWIDAGWYEPLDRHGIVQVEDWQKLGDWRVSRAYHPDGYRKLVDYLSERGVGFMVWFEPERQRKDIKIWTGYLQGPDKNNLTVMTALNDDATCDDVINMVSTKVDELSLRVYRQDFNMDALAYWTPENVEERWGMTEVKYINNFYRFWDTLLERHPGLLIDCCAGGGHRIDIETLSRAVPMWRSDFQCTWDCCPEGDQNQNSGAAWWYPYSGIGYGPTLGDTYGFRSAYTSGITVRTWEHDDPEWRVGGSGEPLDWAKKYFDEYVSLRPYFNKDYYRLIPLAHTNTNWTASEFFDPETGTGIILAFRRARCPSREATVRPGGLKYYSDYRVTNTDTGESTVMPGYLLMRDGISLTLENPRQSGIWRIERVGYTASDARPSEW